MDTYSHLIQSCSTPGCTVKIRVPSGQQESVPVCRWCERGLAYNTRDPMQTRFDDSEPIDLSEFGNDLFNAIEAQAGAIQANHSYALFVVKDMPREAEVASQAGKACQQRLEEILKLNTISVSDVKRILSMQ